MDTDLLDDDSVLNDLFDIAVNPSPTHQPTAAAAATVNTTTTTTTTTDISTTATAPDINKDKNLENTLKPTDVPKQTGKSVDMGVVSARPPPPPLPQIKTSALAPQRERIAQNTSAPSPVQTHLLRAVAMDSPFAVSPLGAIDSPLDLDRKFSNIANSPNPSQENMSQENGSAPTDSVSRDRLDSVDLTFSDDEFEAGWN